MMTVNEKFRLIEDQQESIPVQVVPLAEALGLKVYKAEGWDDDISGKIERDKQRGGTSDYAIYVNASHPVTRRRFTIAHEIAHFVLHPNLIGDGIYDDGLYRSKLRHNIETQANRLAASILMPEKALQEKLAEGIDSVPQLAEVFHVSRSAMSIRLGVPYEQNS